MPGAPPSIEPGVRPGDVLAGKYRVERVLGSGGMGVVVAARHLQLDEMVALKLLRERVEVGSEAAARFLREARASARIKNEHVARVTDVGQLDDGAPYMVMEYLEGTDLAQWLRDRGPMPVEQAVDFVLQACEAIADAHALGIVHRDLKPANLFCVKRSDGQLTIKVLDFGISKVTTPGSEGHDVTRTNALMGTPLYMSPEQLKHAKNIDARTDIWALGVILYELVTGRPPFAGDAVTEIAINIANDSTPTVAAAGIAAPEQLDQVLSRALQKDRAARLQNVGELAAALADLGSPRGRISAESVLGTLRRAGISTADLAPADAARGSAPAPPAPPAPLGLPAPPASVAQPPFVQPGAQTAAAWGQTGRGTKSRRTPWLVALALVVVVSAGAVAVGVAIFVRGRAAANPAGSVAGPSATAAAEGPVPSSGFAGATPADAPAPAPPQPSGPAAPPSLLPSPTPSAAGQPPPAVARPPTSAQPPAPWATPPPPPTPPPAPSPPSPPSTPKPSCSPPYVIDAHGDRQYKPECLR